MVILIALMALAGNSDSFGDRVEGGRFSELIVEIDENPVEEGWAEPHFSLSGRPLIPTPPTPSYVKKREQYVKRLREKEQDWAEERLSAEEIKVAKQQLKHEMLGRKPPTRALWDAIVRGDEQP